MPTLPDPAPSSLGIQEARGSALFVGEDREDILNALCAAWETCQSDPPISKLVILEGNPGVGKTRMVQELFAKLSAAQGEPKYWPDRLEQAAEQSLAGRGRIAPERFKVPSGARPSFAWVAMACRLDETTHPPQPVRALIPAVQALEVLHEREIVRQGRGKRIFNRVWRLGAVGAGFVVAILGFLGYGGLLAVLVGLVVALWAIYAERESFVALRTERQKQKRESHEVAIDFAEFLRDASADSEIRADKFLSGLTKQGKHNVPVVVIVDDASWADDDTIKLVDAILKRAAPVLVVATVRPDPFEKQFEESSGFGRLAQDFRTKTRRFNLNVLSDKAMTEIVLARAPRTLPAVARAIAQALLGYAKASSPPDCSSSPTGLAVVAGLSRFHIFCSWSFRATLHFVGHTVAFVRVVEVANVATQVEEVFLPVLPGDEAKATVGYQFLDCSCCHLLFSFPELISCDLPQFEKNEWPSV